MDKIKEFIDNKLKSFEEEEINEDNIDFLNKLIMIKKNIKKIEEENNMRYYDGYGARGRGRNARRDSRGRYSDDGGNNNGNYGHYPYEVFDRMRDGYEDYMDGMNEYGRSGNYGAKDKSLESLEYMLEAFVNFFEDIQDGMNSPEEVEMIKKYARKIKEM